MPENELSPEDAAFNKRRQRWKVFGWGVIAAMALLLAVNQFIFVDPDLNRILLIVLFVAYVVYVVLRRR